MERPDSNGIVNASGFPFQMSIARIVERNPGKHNWSLTAQEYPWRDAASSESGFVDIIAGFGAVRLVIECKRGSDATWHFLVDKNNGNPVDTVHCLCTDQVEAEPDIKSWAMLGLEPLSPQAPFCVVRGQAEKEPMLERIASNLLLATESVATQELLIERKSRFENYRFYLPVIVTSAQLLVCHIDPDDVDLANGKIPPEKTRCVDAPLVRFHKAFLTSDRLDAESIEDSYKETLRTIIVVRSTEFKGFLENMDLHRQRPFDPWPHQILRDRMRKASSA